MMNIKNSAIRIKTAILFICSIPLFSTADSLHPGFSKNEYAEMLRISARQVDTPWTNVSIPIPEKFRLEYRSPNMGLDNRWDLWVDDRNVAVISIRGTTASFNSWLANFYAAMVPAIGALHLEKNYTFDYHLADDPKAAVHTGWLVSTGMLSRDILPKVDSLYKSGCRNIIILGHSQGGGIAYLLTSHLYNLRSRGIIPQDLVLKTYCSAAPKPGNLYYAYEFESMTEEGWAFNVINTADWVPEMPVSVQTTSDYNNVNPFINAIPVIKKQKLMQRILLMKIYKRLSGPPRKSMEEYEKILGEKAYSFVKKQLPEFTQPRYFGSINYVRTGNTIVLLADENYRKSFPDNPSNLFMHHFFEPYFYLLNKLKGY